MKRTLACLLLASLCIDSRLLAAMDSMREEFVRPPAQYHSRPLWFWNKPGDTSNEIREIMTQCRDQSGYQGFGILPSVEQEKYLTDPYFALYGTALETAAKLGMKMCVYDEYWFPSGSAGGQLGRAFPEALCKRLDMAATDVTGPQSVTLQAPAGVVMGAVAMRPDGADRSDITACVKEGKLIWEAPEGTWKVMLFTCVRDGAHGLVDYLDPEAVGRFVQLTHQKYYDRFGDYFGKTIDSAFYDEPTFHWIKGGRAWTPAFNEKFKARHGFDPVIYYPALWFDIGPDTAAARNALFGFRAELYATGFPKVLDDWCRAHKIQLTGHVDQEEVVNPVGLCGDLMKAFEHQSIPGIDEIFKYGRSSKAYKIVSSSANNFDHPQVMVECYGATNPTVATLYREAMDLFAKGINLMVPHAVWVDAKQVRTPPELSWRNPVYGPALSDYNQYIGRLQRLLQGGRHVADIAVLYPIATLQAGYRFDVGKPYEGGVIPKEADYMDIGDWLALEVRRDFTFLHPEVLASKCKVEGASIKLENAVNWERFKVFILPGSKTIHLGTLQKLRQFYENGGKVIATTRLPDRAAEFGKDAEVRQAITDIFGNIEQAPESDDCISYPKAAASSTWAGAGFGPENAIDGKPESRWNSAANSGGNQWLEVDFGAPKTFSKTLVREMHERTTAYRIQYWNGSQWVECAKGGQIGAEKRDDFAPVTGSRVRLCLDSINSDCVSISEFAVFDQQGGNLANPAASEGGFTVKTNPRGGKAYFAQRPTARVLERMLDDCGNSGNAGTSDKVEGVEGAEGVFDVRFTQRIETKGGNLSYIHKVVEGKNLFFFANSSDTAVDTYVDLRGRLQLESWDPHTGKTGPAESEPGEKTTRVHLRLEPVHSIFLIE